MESVKPLTVSELLHLFRPLTASSASVSGSNPKPTTSTKPSNPKTLTPLTHRAILTGTLTLPEPSSTNPSLCPTRTCLQFSDGSAAVCCDVLHLDVRLIGTEFHVLAWNFIPFGRRPGGFLEIIKWGFLDSGLGLSECSEVDSIRLGVGSYGCGTDPKAKYRVHGALESICPVSVVPCSSGAPTSESTNVCVFLMQVMGCECKFCCSKESVLGSNESAGGHDDIHVYSKPVFVYFCGFASSWHPVMTKFTGKVVTLSGLKKKMITFTGNEKSLLVFVTTETTVLYLPRPPRKWGPCTSSIVKGKGECGVYSGMVKGVYLRGMVVELDENVWLLLTDQLLIPPHSVRIGALVTVRNVHFVNPKFHWTKLLILGACSKSSITIESFSPLETGCHLVSQSDSLLGKFIDSLTFPARLWVLYLVPCFRKKFASTLSEKEILGSKHTKGLVQIYASSHLPPSVFISRHGVLSELSNHDLWGCGIEPYRDIEPYCVNFKFVTPISSFINHCEIRWITRFQQSEDSRQLSYKIRKIFQSEDTSPVLLGRLKVSPSSGRLQLVDGTDSIDVIIPNLPSTWDNNSIYEVTDYTLVIEGMTDMNDYMGLLDKGSFPLRDVFRSAPLARLMELKIYIYFNMRSTCRIYPKVLMDSCAEVECGKFHLLYITHKFPLLHKGDSVKSSMFAEAIVLPWDLILAREETLLYLNDVSRHHASRNCEKNLPSKRHKNNSTSTEDCSRSATESVEALECHDSSSSHDIPCLATITRCNNQSKTIYGLLSYIKADKKFAGEKTSPRKVLLNLNSENSVRYQIGRYYITKHNRDDSICNLKDGDKVIMTTSSFIWNISFSCDKDLPDDSHMNINEVSSGDQMELHLQSYKGHSAGTCLDVCLHLSADVIGVWRANLKECVECLMESAISRQTIANGFPGSRTTPQLFPGYPNSSCLYPEGNLISLSGDVVHLEYILTDSYSSHRSLTDSEKRRSSWTIRSCICIHVLVDCDIVKISGSLGKYALPIGFGTGVNATFHRLLDFGGKNMMMLMPVTFVAINSIRTVSDRRDNRDDSLQAASDYCDVASRDVSSALSSELIQFSESSLVRFQCRVVSVDILVMKKHERYPRSENQSMSLPIDISVACFVLDDGSSSCYCWASAERAATLLRLHEKLPARAFGKTRSTHHTAIYHLERIVKKHGRVALKKHWFPSDSSCQDLTISVGTENTISSSDESLLKSMVGAACSGRHLTVVGTVMDPDDVRRLEVQHQVEMESREEYMKNIWATQVYYTNPLTEARNILRELHNM